MQKNRNRTHHYQERTGGCEPARAAFVAGVKHETSSCCRCCWRCQTTRCRLPYGFKAMKATFTRHLHCSIVCRIIITFCRSLLHILVCKNPSSFLLHILSGNPQRDRHCLGLGPSGLHKFLDVCRNILFAWL